MSEPMQVENDMLSPEIMLAFYKRLYPFKSIYGWLNHEHKPTRLFTNREFAFTLPGDVYIRYNSFNSSEELKKQICTLNPSRFEIGAVYNAKPRDKKTLRSGALQPIQRELVFDIDMTDYDSIRTCCSGKGICRRCWGFIAAAVEVLDSALRDQFGFQHLLWVYSGRRGVHCWVSDEAAMHLTDDQRKAIMGWLEVIKGGKDMAKKVNVRMGGKQTFHPAIRAAVEKLDLRFTKLILDDQDCFSSEEQWNILLDLIGDKGISSRLRSKWEKDPDRSSRDKWNDVLKESKKSESSHISAIVDEIKLQYTYPRLDSEVTKHRNHLLKAPFCVHPATGRVCVPLDPRLASKFDPEGVPTAGSLLRELNESALTAKEEQSEKTASPSVVHDWEKTSLKPYIDLIDQHILSIMDENRREKREKGDISMEL